MEVERVRIRIVGEGEEVGYIDKMEKVGLWSPEWRRGGCVGRIVAFADRGEVKRVL